MSKLINRGVLLLTILLLAGHALSAEYQRAWLFTALTGDVQFWPDDVIIIRPGHHQFISDGPMTHEYSIEMQSTARAEYEASAAQFQEECNAQGNTAELDVSFREAPAGLVEREIEGLRIYVETSLWYVYGTWRCIAVK